jgi:hypothetical protein
MSLSTTINVAQKDDTMITLHWDSQMDDTLDFAISSKDNDLLCLNVTRADVRRMVNVLEFWLELTSYWGPGV